MRVTSVRMDESKLHRLDALAKTMGQSRGQVIGEAVDRFIEYHEWFLDAVETGIRDADAGRIVAPEDVKAAFAAWGVDVG